MFSPVFFLTTVLAAGGTLASPTAPLEKRCINCSWIGYYRDGSLDCKSGDRTNKWLEINNEELEKFERPANTTVGVHFGTGIGFANSISRYTDKEGTKGAHNFLNNVHDIFQCYNDTSDWAWSVPWLSARASGD